MDILITTFLKRPYVFLFLAGFLFLGIRHLGLLKTLVWLVTGYLIAFLSEYSSIHNGFPYGEYHYIYENLQGELMFAGVPVWDSISYSFMTYAGFSAAAYAMPKAKLWKLWLAGATLTTFLDVITDPVAKLGKQWFLGEIYYYANEGWYFGVPLSNFAGWFLVAAAIIGVNLLIFSHLPAPNKPKIEERSSATPPSSWMHMAFYVSICLFNTGIAFYINATSLGTVNLLITLIISAGILLKRKYCGY